LGDQDWFLHFADALFRRYHTNKGLPQGLLLSLFLFGASVADILPPCLRCSPAVHCVVSSHLEDVVILIAADGKDLAHDTLTGLCEDYVCVARERNMGFSALKTQWFGFGDADWDVLGLGGHDAIPVDKLRVLGYWINIYANYSAHVDYWLCRRLDVRRRISVLGRRYGGVVGIGGYEKFQLFRSAYLSTVYYGLEFLTSFSPYVKWNQVHVNHFLHSIFHTAIKLANNILLTEWGTPPVHVQGQYLQRRYFAKMINKRFCEDHPWCGCICNDWRDDGIVAYLQSSDKQLVHAPVVTTGSDKNVVCRKHLQMLEEWAGDLGVILYMDDSKNASVGRALIAWIVF